MNRAWCHAVHRLNRAEPMLVRRRTPHLTWPMSLQLSHEDALWRAIAESGSSVEQTSLRLETMESYKFVDILVASSDESNMSLVVEHFADRSITQGG